MAANAQVTKQKQASFFGKKPTINALSFSICHLKRNNNKLKNGDITVSEKVSS